MFGYRLALFQKQFPANRPNFKRHKLPKCFAKSKPHFRRIVESPIVQALPPLYFAATPGSLHEEGDVWKTV
jgi:hypothetical protein